VSEVKVFIQGTILMRYARLIAIMLGRLRCSVDEAINIYKIMWDGIGKEIPYMDRVIRGNAGKKACSSGLGCALDDILKDQQKLRCIETRKGHPDDVVKFQSSPGICKTYVFSPLLGSSLNCIQASTCCRIR